MAIKFNSKKYEQVKSEYIKFLHEGVASSNAMNNFKNYKLFLEEDNEIKAIRDEINRSQKIKVSINVINSPKKSYKHQSNNNYPLYTKEEVQALTYYSTNKWGAPHATIHCKDGDL